MAEKAESIYQSAVIEVRPRLQSVNVVAVLRASPKDVKANLDEHHLELVVDDESISADFENAFILKESLSDIKISDKFISFRFHTSGGFGSFRSELVQHPRSTAETRHQREDAILYRGKPCVLRCMNCLNALSGEIHFTRVLPLPSDASDPSEWFCHSHSSSGNINLNPKITDIFYTHCYAHVNIAVLANAKFSTRIVVCGRCLCWLGLVKNATTVHFWFNTIGIQYGNTFHNSIALNDVFVTIKDTLKHKLATFAKFIFTCESATTRTDYILIWIIEKKLNLMLYIDGENPEKKFQEKDVAKVLYKFYSEKNESVQEWLNDPMVTAIGISKPMAHALTTHLHKYNKLSSEEFNKSNGFFVSYLLMY